MDHLKYNYSITPYGPEGEAYELPSTPSSHDAFLKPSRGPSPSHSRQPSSYSLSPSKTSEAQHEHHAPALIRFLEYLVPMLGTVVLSAALASLAIFSSASPIVAPPFIQSLGYADPKLWTAIFTVLASVLSACLGYCYSTMLRIVVRKFIVARSHRLKTLAGWIDLRNASLSTVKGPIWFVLTGLSIVLLGVITTCVNTLISPIPLPIPLQVGTAEPDLASDAFREWYLTNGSVPQCSWWVSYRNGLQPTCVVGNSLPALLDAGRAAVNVALLGDAGYTWFGRTVFSGTTGGVLPISPEDVTPSVGQETDAERLALGQGLYNYTLGMQGLSASVACTNASSSPLFFNASAVVQLDSGAGEVQSQCACCGAEPVVQFVGGNWVQAGVCNDTERGTWDFYLRHYGQYARDGDENLTCTITPYLTSATSTYLGQIDQHNISSAWPLKLADPSVFGPMLALLPQAIQLGQNTQNNLVLESVTAVTNAFYVHEQYEIWYPHVWESYLRGWVEYIGTSIRLQYSSTQPAYSRPIQGSLVLSMYAWQFSQLNILFLSPILLLTLLTLALALWALLYLSATRLPTFDPTEPISLIAAAAWCDDALRRELEDARAKGCDAADKRAKETRVAFRGGGLARVRRY